MLHFLSWILIDVIIVPISLATWCICSQTVLAVWAGLCAAWVWFFPLLLTGAFNLVFQVMVPFVLWFGSSVVFCVGTVARWISHDLFLGGISFFSQYLCEGFVGIFFANSETLEFSSTSSLTLSPSHMRFISALKVLFGCLGLFAMLAILVNAVSFGANFKLAPLATSNTIRHNPRAANAGVVARPPRHATTAVTLSTTVQFTEEVNVVYETQEARVVYQRRVRGQYSTGSHLLPSD